MSEDKFKFFFFYINSLFYINSFNKVGGVDKGVGVANGNVYGNGVYSATGPSTPMGYSKTSNTIILAKALIGNQIKATQPTTDCDSWIPQADWMIFKKGDQLLPTYVVHY